MNPPNPSQQASKPTASIPDVPRWVLDLPAKPCPAHDGSDLSDNVSVKDPKACWRVYTSNADVRGLPPGMKRFRCSAWTPVPSDFQDGAA